MDSAFPPEVLRIIGSWLPQAELLSLAFTCKRCYKILRPEIYRAVVIDSKKRAFDLANGQSHDNTRIIDSTRSVFEPVVIRSLFNLKCFLKTLISNPWYAGFINVLTARDHIPDIPAIELHRLLSKAIPNMTNLRVFTWHSMDCPLDATILTLLPNSGYLDILRGNFESSTSIFPQVNLSSVTSLELSNLGSSKSLAALNFDSFPKTKYLKLSKSPSSGMLDFPSYLDACCRQSLEQHMETLVSSLHEDESTTYLEKLLGAKSKQSPALTSLSLSGLTLTARDAQLILDCIDLSCLSHFSLESCFESYIDEQSNSQLILPERIRRRRRNPPSRTFLDVLFENVRELESLNISLANDLCFNQPTFKAISSSIGLTKLSVHLKTFCSSGPSDFKPFIESIKSHKDTLRYLSICNDIVARPSTPLCPKKNNHFEIEFILELGDMNKLEFLRLPLAYAQVKEIPRALSKLSSLKIMHLLVTDSSLNSSSSCNACPMLAKNALCHANSLIAQDFFDCASSYFMRVEDELHEHYLKFATTYRRAFKTMSYLRFDLRDLSLLFDCTSSNTVSRDQYFIKDFDRFINLSINTS